MSDEQIKVVYFAPRPAGRSDEAFRARWRQHGALAMRLPMWRHMCRYQQFDALGAAEHGVASPLLAAAQDGEVAGVGVVWMRSAEALAAVLDDPDVGTLRTDEVATFGDELGARLVPVREHVVLDRGPAAVTLLAQVWRQPRLSRERFSEGWREVGGRLPELAELARHVRRYVQNHTLADVDAWDGVVELGFGSEAAAVAFLSAPTLADTLMPLEAEFIDHARLVLVLGAEHVL